MDLSSVRKSYGGAPLDDVNLSDCPFEQFEIWFEQAIQQQITEPNAMVLTTVGPDHRPTLRTVLLKYFDKSGFVFFTNYESRKALQIEGNQHVSALFPWYQLRRQIEINGFAEKVSAMESAKYFALRPRGSQLGAWVSQQSQVVASRRILANKLKDAKQRFLDGKVPKPPAWGGFRVKPYRIEFWQGGEDRLHDRIEYSKSPESKLWHQARLAP